MLARIYRVNQFSQPSLEDTFTTALIMIYLVKLRRYELRSKYGRDPTLGSLKYLI